MILVSLGLYLAGVVILTGFGLTILSKYLVRLTPVEKVSLSFVIGSVGYLVLIYLLSWLKLRILATFILLILSTWGYFNYRKNLEKIILDWKLGLIILMGVMSQLVLVASSGWRFVDGDRYLGVNAHDGLWHVAIMKVLSKSFPASNPAFSGQLLKNYHYLSDLLGSEFVKWLGISGMDLYFRWLPLTFSILLGLLTFSITTRLTPSKLAGYLAVIFMYFAGSMGYLMYFINPNANWETAFWAMQSVSTFINFPLGMSMVIILSVFILIHLIKKDDNWLFVVVAVCSGILMGVKAYGGFLMIAGLFAVGGYDLFWNRSWKMIAAAVLSLVVGLAITIPLTSSVGSSFIIEPGWFYKTLMQAPDMMDMVEWELRRQTYVVESNIPRIIQLWGIAFGVFLVGNLGVRMLGFLEPLMYRDLKRSVSTIRVRWVLWAIFVMGIIMPTLLLQRGIVWNAIQFFYYSMFVMNILTAVVVARLLKNRSPILVGIVMLAILILTLPTTIKSVSTYALMHKNDHYELISNNELEALEYFNNSSHVGAILANFNPNAYITAYTGKDVYYADETQAVLLGLDFEEREKNVEDIFCRKLGGGELRKVMEENNLSHVYISDLGKCKPEYLSDIEFLSKVFKNDEVTIYELDP